MVMPNSTHRRDDKNILILIRITKFKRVGRRVLRWEDGIKSALKKDSMWMRTVRNTVP